MRTPIGRVARGSLFRDPARGKELPRRQDPPATALALLVVSLALGLPGVAGAQWGPGAELASVDWGKLEQANGAATAVDVSGDGRFVVFQTRASNFFADGDADPPGRIRQGGIFRYDRTTRAIELVADGDQLDEQTGELRLRGASAPSVSDDGRHIAFASAQRLVPQDVNDHVDVYVRDMAVPLTADRAASGAYRLASARDGGDVPAAYEPRVPPVPWGNPGSAVHPGQAISGDGRYVAFRSVEQASDLPDRPAVETPGGNVFVRDLVARRTVLVSRTLDGAAAAGGALAPVVLSRDGSTVAWVGQNVPLQTRVVTGDSLDNGQRAYLWRRWDDLGATTRRVTGPADADDPACPPDGVITANPLATGPCYGPLGDLDAGFGDIGGRAPALSADGWTVAFVSGASPRPTQDPDVYLDAYVTSMRPGVSRKAGTRTVTRGSAAANPTVNGDVESVALSGDGNRLLLVTGRRQFLAPAPPLVGSPRAAAGGAELYLVDFAHGETRRLLRTPAGGDVDGGVDPGVALSADGTAIAFVAATPSLFPGDANEIADAFIVAERPDADGGGPPTGVGQDPIQLDVGGERELGMRIVSRRDGTLLLRVAVPRPGALAAVAVAQPAAGNAKARGRRGSRARARRVAAASARARRIGRVQLRLALRGRDLRAVRRGRALRASVTLTLAPADGSAARRVVATATFRAATRSGQRARRG
jgi:WD40-like Beta Propeller Repeat